MASKLRTAETDHRPQTTDHKPLTTSPWSLTPACPQSRNYRVSPTARAKTVLCPQMESGFQCASCGEWNVTSVDESAGRRQSYVEDCQVCCKPNVLRVEYDNSSQEFFITAELE